MIEINDKLKLPFALIITEINQLKMVTRKIIKIDENLCTDCDNCVVDGVEL